MQPSLDPPLLCELSYSKFYSISSNLAILLDQDFEKGFGQWKSLNFVRKAGKASNDLFGPDKDHTSEVQPGGGNSSLIAILQKIYTGCLK